MQKNKKTKHSVYNLNYHIVFVTKYRHKIIQNDIEDYIRKRIMEICKEYDWEILALEIMPDHIHLFSSAKPEIAPLTISSTIKSILTMDVFQKFSNLKEKYFWGSGLFSRGCYYGSAGAISSEIIKKYIKNQKDND